MEILIERIANAYFWVFIIIQYILLLYGFTDEYKNVKAIKIAKGKYNTNIDLESLLIWILFVLSCYYR